MKILAHYTIFDNSIFNLHTFEIENDIISHKKVVEETAHTAFIQGILIIADHKCENYIDEINALVTESKNSELKQLAEKIASFINEKDLNPSQNGKFSLLISTYPDFIVSKL